MARNEDRAVQVPAELVIAKSLSREVSAIALPGVGIERVVAEVLKDAAVEVARAALGDQANQTARGAAILCRITGSQNLHLRGGIHIGHARTGAVRARTHHLRSVERLHDLLAARAVYVCGDSKCNA